MVAEKQESFSNHTLRIREEVDEALMDIGNINRNATFALTEAQSLQGTLQNSSETLRKAEEVALFGRP